MQEKKKLVAISLKQDQVFLVKNVGENEYKSLLNNQHKYDSEQERKDNEINKKFERQDARLFLLERKSLFLAKAIYDNFVEKGLVDDNDDFQQEWYDYFFNDKPLSIDDCPIEFKKILDKVGR